MENRIALQKTVQEVVVEAENGLIEQGYSFPVIHDNKYVWKCLCEYAAQKGETYYSLDLAVSFGRAVYQIDILKAPVEGNRRAARALRVLEDCDKLGFIRRRVYTRNLSFSASYEGMCREMLKKYREQGFSDCILRQLHHCASDFTHYLHRENISTLYNLQPSHILDFLQQGNNLARETLAKKVYLLRLLMKYAVETERCDESILVRFPRVKHVQQAKIPATLEKHEIRDMLMSIDRETAFGKRDYAILLLVVQLGIRAGDIRSLKLENIRWDENRITFAQSKTGRIVSLPLLTETGWALIDYLKNGRPKSESQHVFLRHLYPHEPFGHFNNLHAIISKHLKASGVDTSALGRHGLHALRHSLASAMLAEHVSMPVISEVLGHSDTRSTNVYLRVDMTNLRACALEVPV